MNCTATCVVKGARIDDRVDCESDQLLRRDFTGRELANLDLSRRRISEAIVARIVACDEAISSIEQNEGLWELYLDSVSRLDYVRAPELESVTFRLCIDTSVTVSYENLLHLADALGC